MPFTWTAPYSIDFPLRVGNPPPVGIIGIITALVVMLLVGVTIAQRRRLISGKAAINRDQQPPP